MFFESSNERLEIILHVFFDSVELMNFFFLNGFTILNLLFQCCIASKLKLKLSLFDGQIQDLRSKLLNESFVEFKFLGIINFVEFDNKVWVKVQEDTDSIDKSLQDF